MENKKGILLVFGTAVISGFSIFINKFGVALSDPVVYAFLKNFCVALIVSGILFFIGGFKNFREISRKSWMKLVAIGVIGGSIPFILFFKGLALTSAAQGSFIQKSMFVFVMILAGKFLKEKITTPFVLGGALLFLGNALFLRSLDMSFGIGDWMILGATVLWAIENTISKKVLIEVDWKVVVWSRMTFGSLLILLYILSGSGISQLSSISSFTQIGWIAITAILLLGYQITWYQGLKLIPVSVATSILLIGSSITTSLNFIQKGQVDWRLVLAGLATVLGIAIILGSKVISSKSREIINYVRS